MRDNFNYDTNKFKKQMVKTKTHSLPNFVRETMAPLSWAPGVKKGTNPRIKANISLTSGEPDNDGNKITIDVMRVPDGIRLYLDDPKLGSKKVSTLVMLDTDNAKWLSQKIVDVINGVGRSYEG